MSNFIVSARKYRPVQFQDVVGQQHISQTLKNALQNNQLAHAFLFCGPRGVGKTTCARILAKTLNCESRTAEQEACGVCASCKAFAENSSFNIIELDAASNNSVENIRALIDQVRFQPQQGKYKIFIIDEVHMLSAQAFNAFLKTLEEPPPYAIFILATTEKHKILPTILSRCQIFDFRRIQPLDIVHHLQDICEKVQITADSEALHIIAQKADGGLRDALSIFDRIVSYSNKKITYQAVIESLNVLDYDYFFRIIDAMLIEDLPTVMLTFDEVLRKGFEADIFINGLMEHIRNIVMCKDERTLQLMEASDILKNRYHQQATASHPMFLLSALNLLNECDVNYKMARNKRLHVEMALIKATHIFRAIRGGGITPPSTLTAVPAGEEKKNPERKLTSEATPSVVAEDAPPLYIPPQEIPISVPKKEQKLPSHRGISLNLNSIEAQVKAAQQINKKQLSEYRIEEIQQQWLKFAETVESPTLKNSIQTAALHLDGEELVVEATNSIACQLLFDESMRIIDFLKNALQLTHFIPIFKVNPQALAQQKTEVRKPVTAAEKFQKMVEENPAVADFVQHFGFKPDE